MNRLANETSPYLQEHADNPVDWYPWCDEAFAKAKREDKPVLLSIGYSACHWCHVMARESFSDQQVAEIMNRYFVNIKVDREERPDLDHIYQLVFQLLNQRAGGWPLTIFMSPDQRPFFAGTYFPKNAHPQMPDFPSLLEKISQVWQENRNEIDHDTQAVQQTLDRFYHVSADSAEVNEQPLRQAVDSIGNQFDSTNGGFGSAPKFPQASTIEYLLYYAQRQGDESAQRMALQTLDSMAYSGLYDHIRGGFYRYCVDAEWQIPHFEKMLYDNGLLLSLYSEAYALTQNPHYRQAAVETRDWLMREMASPEGGFYASLNAETEGEEGRFYLWDAESLKQHFEPQIYQVMANYYGLDRDPNFEGQWHLACQNTVDQVSRNLDISLEQVESDLRQARDQLFELQNQRQRPERDEKQLTSWNSLCAKGLARMALCLNDPEALEQAENTLLFIYNKLFDGSRLAIHYKDGETKEPAFVDDYVFLIEALTSYLQVEWRSDFWQWLWQLIACVQNHFEDKTQGGLFFTGDDHEALIYRPKDYMDASLPSANGVGLRVFSLLGYLTGDQGVMSTAQGIARNGWQSLQRAPQAHCSLLTGLLDHLRPPELLVLRADSDTAEAVLQSHRNYFRPDRLVWPLTVTDEELPASLTDKATANQTVAYPCHGYQCYDPVTGLERIQHHIQGDSHGR